VRVLKLQNGVAILWFGIKTICKFRTKRES